MTSPFDVSKKASPISWWQLLIVASLFVGLLFILFPQQLFIQSVLHTNHPDSVSLSFLKNLSKQYPSDDLLKIALADQAFQLGEVHQARQLINVYLKQVPISTIDWKAQSLNYLILRVEAYELPVGDPLRQSKEIILQNLLHLLVHSPYLNAEEGVMMANDALAFNLPMLAVSFYKKVLSQPDNKPVALFADAAKAMLFVKDYQGSATYYLLAMQHSTELKSKRTYYLHAIDSLKASGKTSAALTFAQKNIDGLSQDEQTLIYLTKLALSANQQKTAQDYIKQVLQLNHKGN